MSVSEQPIKDAVITVPAYFNQAERRAVLHAARMADLKVLQLINDNTAVALNYGVFRRKDINATAQVGVTGRCRMPHCMHAGRECYRVKSQNTVTVRKQACCSASFLGLYVFINGMKRLNSLCVWP